jgi:hypothetical protein
MDDIFENDNESSGSVQSAEIIGHLFAKRLNSDSVRDCDAFSRKS